MAQPEAKRSKPVSDDWSPTSWRGFKIKHQPIYTDAAAVKTVCDEISRLPSIVQPSEIEALKKQLGEVAAGRRFILQGGDCAERFVDCTPDRIEAKLKILLQMSLVLVWGARVPLVRIGRIAGQYMKPRSNPTEVVEGKEVFSYKGDSVNSFDDLSKRVPDPSRLREAFMYSTATMNYVRGLMSSGFADLHRPETWDLSFVKHDGKREKYEEMIKEILRALEFMEACGAGDDPTISQASLYSSHEGLVLDFEEAVTRKVGDKYYNLGAHFIWIGDRTRQLDGAHVEYFRGIANPIGIKVGPTTDPKELVELIAKINPTNEPGRVTLITRFGAGNVAKMLPPVIRAVKAADLLVAYECDPMHGNTRKAAGGIKTRSFSDILTELLSTFDVHQAEASWLGGVHFELTGDDVTECTGGAIGLEDTDLSTNYESFCDPRLNCHQSLEMAFLIADRLKSITKHAYKNGAGSPADTTTS
eukprot:TRINITY_DN1145_c0_g1_i1.p1 TRINITY_DN1145_c0_g1~~TRINITY_DN1145_c0_g1_i1.p1  ORF type:complete len:473 (+),score=117.76 TRINITY_DN1145_c0_g1_i1:163-1581(+)